MERLTYTNKSNGMSVPRKLVYDINMDDTKFAHLEEIVKKLAYYEDLEESGKLLRLPCRVGDILYLTDHECTEGMKYNCEIDGIMEGYLCRNCGTYPCTLAPSVQEVVVDSIKIVEDNEIIIEFKDLREVKIDAIGKTVFLTREEAEEKFKEATIDSKSESD